MKSTLTNTSLLHINYLIALPSWCSPILNQKEVNCQSTTHNIYDPIGKIEHSE